MLYQRTYLDKCATIVDGSKLNTGFNPVADLVYGRNISRMLVYFNHERIKSMVEDKTFADISKLTHRLKITNAGSLDMSELHKVYGSQIDGLKKRRATSFDLIYFLIPQSWDNGKGFDYTRDYFNISFYNDDVYDYKNYISEDGVTWYKPVNGKVWKNNPDFEVTTNEQVRFYIKADTKNISATGTTVEFTYYVTCDTTYVNADVLFKLMYNDMEHPVKLGTPVYYSMNGRPCNGDADIRKYCKYIKVIAEMPANDIDINKKYSFRLEYNLNGKTYKSNPYRITQYGVGEYVYPVTDDGIYSTKTLEEEFQRYESGQESVVIGKQHFDIGYENIDVDITDVFNKFITGELQNYGIGIAYAPNFEYTDSDTENYVGLLTNRTNTFFEPYVETIYHDNIKDDRQNFVLGRKNRLYLYANVGGNLVNLDKIPTCSIDGEPYEVKQATKGVYYVEVKLPYNAFTAPTMLYDTWDEIVYQGQILMAVEQEFTTRPAESFFTIGNKIPEKTGVTPSVYGISDNEIIKRGDMRKVCFEFLKTYSKNTAIEIDEVDVRLYIKDGTAQNDVIPYMELDRSFTDTYIMVDTSILIPNTYYMDVRIKYGQEIIEHRDILHFKIVDNLNNKYC